MADIELVIKIPNKVYKAICDKNALGCDIGDIKNIIRNGTPLPKGHGRLIAEPTEEKIAKTIGGKNDFADCIREAVKTVFANELTIIEADKAESE